MSDQSPYTQGAVASANQPSDYISLPFEAPIFWWVRGDPSVQPDVSLVRHCGGWATKEESFDNLPAIAKPDVYSPHFTPEVHASTSGAYSVYVTQTLIIARIGLRERWDEELNKGFLHALVLLALWDSQQKKFETWTPAVLSLKGMMSLEYKNTLKKWDDATAKARRGVPGYFYWVQIGTLTTEIQQKTVGQRTKNYITPCVARVPAADNLTAEAMDKLLVSQEVAASMNRMAEEAHDWLADWKKPRPTQAQQISQAKQAAAAKRPADDDLPF